MLKEWLPIETEEFGDVVLITQDTDECTIYDVEFGKPKEGVLGSRLLTKDTLDNLHELINSGSGRKIQAMIKDNEDGVPEFHYIAYESKVRPDVSVDIYSSIRKDYTRDELFELRINRSRIKLLFE